MKTKLMSNSTIPRLFESMNAFPLPDPTNHNGNTQIQDNSPLIYCLIESRGNLSQGVQVCMHYPICQHGNYI